eukprot:4515873-Prorocentrum_lima.AAC.1
MPPPAHENPRVVRRGQPDSEPCAVWDWDSVAAYVRDRGWHSSILSLTACAHTGVARLCGQSKRDPARAPHRSLSCLLYTSPSPRDSTSS